MRFPEANLLAVLAVILGGPAQASPGSEKALGSLVLKGATLGAEVYIDGDKVGMTPLAGPLWLSPTEHTLKVTKPGFAPLIDVIHVQRHRSIKVDVDLTPVSGVLRVRSNIAEARVFVDGKFVGQAPLETELPVGARAIQVSRGGYKDFFRNVESVAGQEVALEVALDELPADVNPYKPKAPPPPKWYEKWWVWTAGVVGVGVIVTAVAVPVALTRSEFPASYTFTVPGTPAPR